MPIPVIDGHNDVLLRIAGPERDPDFDFFSGSDTGHIDWPRARAGGFAAGFFAVFVPGPEREPVLEPDSYSVPMAPALDPSHAAAVADQMLAGLDELASGSDGRLRVVRDVDALRACTFDGCIGAIAHLEGAEPIDPGLERLQPLYERGVRSIGITWSRPNAFASGVPFAFPSSPDTGPGLTDAGRRLVRACNELGIVVDLSHLNLAGFNDVARTSSAPLVATHSNANAVCASTRNLTDAQLDAIRDSGGIAGLNFEVSFVRADGAKDTATPVAEIARHASYIADRIGVEHLGIGSDFDGCKVPDEVRDARGLPRVLDALTGAGFNDGDIRRIAHENWLRVLQATWRG